MARRKYLTADYIGKKINRWTVMGDSSNNHRKWSCQCECGTVRDVISNDVIRGSSRSCGCLWVESQLNCHRIHGMAGNNRVYNSWKNMKSRCYNKNNIDYKNYGGRGIAVCDEWKNDFQKFYQDFGQYWPGEGFSIDRIDPNGNYCLGNVRWADNQTQGMNRRNTHKLTYRGITASSHYWAKFFDVSFSTICKHARERGSDAAIQWAENLKNRRTANVG